MKFFLLSALIMLSMDLYAVSMDASPGQFGIRFENLTGDREMEITNVKSTAVCSTLYRGIFKELDVATNTLTLKSSQFPDVLHVGTAGESYVQLSISSNDSIRPPWRAFYQEKKCELFLNFNVLVTDERSGDALETGEIQALLLRSDRDNVNIVQELNAIKNKKFTIQTALDGVIEFIFSEGGTYRLQKLINE